MLWSRGFEVATSGLQCSPGFAIVLSCAPCLRDAFRASAWVPQDPYDKEPSERVALILSQSHSCIFQKMGGDTLSSELVR